MAVKPDKKKVTITLDGEQPASTVRELTKLQRAYYAEWQRTTLGTKEFREETKKLSEVNARLRELKAETTKVHEGFFKLGETAKEIAHTIVAAFAIEKIAEFGKASVEAAAEAEEA